MHEVDKAKLSRPASRAPQTGASRRASEPEPERAADGRRAAPAGPGWSLSKTSVWPSAQREHNQPGSAWDGAQRKAGKASLPAAPRCPGGKGLMGASEIPSGVREVLGSPGQSLDPAVRAFMEPRFGFDFGRVRVHADAKAGESAKAVDAQAYAVGQHVVFGPAQYAFGVDEGRRLLAHELAHVVQQSSADREPPAASGLRDIAEAEAEAEAAERIVSGGRAPRITPVEDLRLARQPASAAPKQPTPAATASSGGAAPMTRADFEKVLKDGYRVKAIRTGTFQDQRFGDMEQSKWQAWDPGSASATYALIVDAFRNFETTFAGVPPVNEIHFFATSYQTDDNGHVTPQPGVGASYGLGRLTIYKGVADGNVQQHVGDSFAKPSPDEATRWNITHELGHGIAEIALDQPGVGPAGQDPDLFRDYARQVGWTAGAHPELYDIQAPGVADALQNNSPPPAAARITPGNWYLSKWKERPLTGYMTDNSGDDFAEAIAAYGNDPGTLKSLSPARYKFIDERKAKWGPSAARHINIWQAAQKGGATTHPPTP